MKHSERLMKKVKREFPHVHVDKRLPFRRVYGLPDGVKIAWSNWGVCDNHIYSYYTMKSLLKTTNWGVRWCNGLGISMKGWEIFLVDQEKWYETVV